MTLYRVIKEEEEGKTLYNKCLSINQFLPYKKLINCADVVDLEKYRNIYKISHE
jgi:hypothetical protein